MKYIIKKYQVIYQNGSRDKITLKMPIETKDVESLRAKLAIKHSSLGREVRGVNLEYDEINIRT